MKPTDLYRTCSASAWRVEALQHYTVPGDEERQRAFHAGKPLPPPREELLDDFRLVAELRAAGRQVGRVHVVDRPLSDYVRYELAVYQENVSAGEDVRIADRSLHPELAAVTADFTIFDAEAPGAAVILFDYDGTGLICGYRIITGSRAASPYRETLELALALSVPLGEFTGAATTR